MAYNGILQVVIDTATTVVKRYGHCDMVNDGIFDSGTETLIEKNHRFIPSIDKSDWTWDGSAFVEGSPIVEEDSSSNIQQVDVDKQVNNSSYKKIARIIYNGKKTGIIKEIEAICYADSPVTTYDLRVIDRKNNSDVVAEITGLSNVEPDIVVLANLESLGDKKTILEIQMRRIGNTKAYLDSLLLKY